MCIRDSIFTLRNKATRKFWSRLILFQKSVENEGYSSADPALPKYQGAKGVALTILRPAGSALINGDKLDVVTRGEFIEPGSEIEVILIEGLRIVVREIPRLSRENEDNGDKTNG
jgi:membrane-bound ClpP family serine protease